VKLGGAHRRPLVRCPVCAAPNDAAAGLVDGDDDRAPPRPGDVAVCLGCSSVLLFAPGGSLVAADVNTVTQLMTEEPLLADMVIAATAARRG
jgi:hypothetical protein